tara:strand:- start:3059 stop:3583 length:525 start_codon:yes stop_codon:yes gene_type:complete
MRINKTDYSEGAICKSYLFHAYRMAEQSPDPSTQVGAVIVHPEFGPLSHGYNSPPVGVEMTEEILHSKHKYYYMEHAERNAIFDSMKAQYKPKGCTMYSTWAACPDCARAIIASGIIKVVSHKEMYEKYSGSMKEIVDIGISMMEKAGIEVVLWSGDVSNGKIKIRTSGKLWSP